MNIQSKKHILSLAPLILFFVLAVCILYVSVMGINISKSISARNSSSYALRTAYNYTSVKVQSANSKNDIFTEDFGGYDTLVIKEAHNGKDYLTRIYCCDGYLRELFCAADATLSPADGEKLLKLNDMSISNEDDVLNIRFTESGGKPQTLILYEVCK